MNFVEDIEGFITLHIKYRKPIRINGFVVETDKIIFGSREELNKYLKGDFAYDILDDSVRKSDNEILLHATDENENIIWRSSENQAIEEQDRIKNSALKRKCR